MIIVQESSVIITSLLFLSMSVLFALIDTNSEGMTASGFSPVQAIDMSASLGTAFLPYAIPLVAGQSIAKQNDSGIAKLMYAAYPRFWHRLITATLGITVWAWSLFILSYAAGFLTVTIISANPPGVSGFPDFQPLLVSLMSRLFGFAALAGFGVGIAALFKRVSAVLSLLIVALFAFPLAAHMLREPVPLVAIVARWFPMAIFNRAAEAGLYSSESTASVALLYAIMAIWVAGALGCAAWRISKRDIS